MCALYDVNKKYNTEITYEWAQTRVASLRERYELFCWAVDSDGVIWNNRLDFVTAPDHVWRRPRWGDVIQADRFDLNVPAPDVGWVEAPQHHEGQVAVPDEGNVVVPAEGNAGGLAEGDGAVLADPVVTLSDSSTDSDSAGSMWRVLDEYYASESDPDSVLPPPGVPRLTVKRENVPLVSPPRQKFSEATSSTTSSLTPLKKES
ncbi:hypothetical protein Salat_1845100 [Sesamum alatum]|uniref:Myb/SANT-like domain-containing protein n=1 Tax=Sesamum alatum TaxID=300844 RepID=A0AAE1Y3M7_9LAMI|nr:hypothetical protein Salat_1845100 [Sesamum alatum]